MSGNSGEAADDPGCFVTAAELEAAINPALAALDARILALAKAMGDEYVTVFTKLYGELARLESALATTTAVALAGLDAPRRTGILAAMRREAAGDQRRADFVARVDTLLREFRAVEKWTDVEVTRIVRHDEKGRILETQKGRIKSPNLRQTVSRPAA